MSSESSFIERLRAIASHPAARGLMDDAAVLAVPAGDIVLTHDMIVEGIHFLPDDPPGDVAWKLLAVNLSDLAAKGAAPLGVLMGYTLGEADWDAAFVAGLADALGHFGVPLFGGDTVAMPARSPRAFSLTAIGSAPEGGAPARSGARTGDALWVTGTIGDAALGLALARNGKTEPRRLIEAYRRPRPRLDVGRGLSSLVHAMADVSDGLLIDAERIAQASGLALTIDLAAIPLSTEAVTLAGGDRAARIAAATGGDDYQLIFAAPFETAIEALALDVTRIGDFAEGAGLALRDGGDALTLPDRLGYLHGGA